MDTLQIVADAGRGLLQWLPSITVWTGAVLLAAVVLDRLLRRRIGPVTRALLYAAVILRAALPTDWQAPLGVVVEAPLAYTVLPPAPADSSTATEPAPAPAISAATAEPTASRAPIDRLGLGLAAAYLLGLAVLLCGIVVGLRRGRAARATGEQLEVDRTEVGIHATLGPMVVGLVHPRIVVPRALVDEVDRDVLGAVVRHELAHIRHRDGWIALLLAFACAIAWPVIPVWLAAARIRLALEMRADAAALHGLSEPAVRGYRRLLLELAAQRWGTPALGVGLGPLAGLRTRLAAMKLVPRTPWPLQLLFTAPLAIALLFCAGRRGEPTASATTALGGVGALRLDTRPIPFPHCRGSDPARVIPIPAEADPTQLEDARNRIGMMSAALLGPPVESIEWTIALEDVVPEPDAPGMQIAVAEARFVRGLAHLRHGRLAEAEQDLAEAGWTAASMHDTHLAAEAAFSLVEVVLELGRRDEAMAWSRHAEAAARHLGEGRWIARADAERAYAKIAEHDGRPGDAAAHVQRAALLDAECDMIVRDLR